MILYNISENERRIRANDRIYNSQFKYAVSGFFLILKKNEY